jgi:hypothetical protein
MDSYRLANGIRVTYNPTYEVYRPGGPWVGRMQINDKPYDGEFAVVEPLLSNDQKLLILAPFYTRSLWIRSRFRVRVISLETGYTLDSRKGYDEVTLLSVSEETVTISPNLKHLDDIVLKMDKKNFIEVEPMDLACYGIKR